MFKNLGVGDFKFTPFKVHKAFSFTEVDSGSGVFVLEGHSGSFNGFNSSSAASQSIGQFSEESKSLGYPKDEWYSVGTWYHNPVWHAIRHLYFKGEELPNPWSANCPQVDKIFDDDEFSWPRPNETRLSNPRRRTLHDSVNVFNIPRKFFGEQIVPGTVRILDNSTSSTLILVDDGYGNIYDTAYSSSYASGTPSNDNSGSMVGNVFYNHGMICITDTGSYTDVGLGSGSNGWEVEFENTKTIYEHEYTVIAKSTEFNIPTNKSATFEGSGSDWVGGNLEYFSTVLPGIEVTSSAYSTIGHYTKYEEYQSNTSIKPAHKLENFVSHSDFHTYVTSIGLYNDNDELLAVSKLAKPIKKSKKYDMAFTIRFDL
ncbi:MAG: hypothetical protein H8E03_01235 [Pelagibacteraceae bacterium]|nr:hypothetical protein [Pelagibacteraceae bacterium]